MDHTLFNQFVISGLLVLVCVVIHGFGLFRLNRALRSEGSTERLKRIDPVSVRGAMFTLAMVVMLIALHGIEIWLFAAAYLAVGALPDLENALYFSTISYSTVGFSDELIDPAWRLVAAFESILGVILLGWSTAFFIRVLSRIDPH
jgi:uncharacterized protein YhhL (DUF1145 family)